MNKQTKLLNIEALDEARLRPIITLNRNVTIASGTGTKTDPYILN